MRRLRRPAAGDVQRLRSSIADRHRRRRLWSLYSQGLSVPTPRAFGSHGAGSMLIPPARIELPELIHLGRNVRIHENSWLCVRPLPDHPPPRLVIGDNVTIGRFAKVVCAGEIVIEDDVLIADQVYLADTQYTHDDPARPIGQQPLATPRPVRIGRGSFLGVRSVVRPGVSIGENAYLGAAAVADCDIPPRSVAVGYPARVVRRYDEGARDWVAVAPPEPDGGVG